MRPFGIERWITIALLLTCMLIPGNTQAFADSLRRPYEKTYVSADETASFTVIPDPGFDIGRVDLLNNDFAEPPIGVMYTRKKDAAKVEVWRRPLTNKWAPSRAIVLNGGDFVITFDEWYQLGYGDSVVVNYGPQGRTVRQFSLLDLVSQQEIDGMARSYSSIW